MDENPTSSSCNNNNKKKSSTISIEKDTLKCKVLPNFCFPTIMVVLVFVLFLMNSFILSTWLYLIFYKLAKLVCNSHLYQKNNRFETLKLKI